MVLKSKRNIGGGGHKCKLLKFYNRINCSEMKIRSLAQLLKSKAVTYIPGANGVGEGYRPTPYLSHPFLQSVYNITEPLFPHTFQRQRLYLQDGGNISLDWLAPEQASSPPILFVMHGLTGGSEMNYIKELMKPAAEEGYCCVCLNSRGINNEMTSPLPFTGMTFNDLEIALQTITGRYPTSPIYMVGTSFGGNYLMRYFLHNNPLPNIKGLVTLAPPLNVAKVVDDMASIYQKFFVKRYIQETVTRHKQMMFWHESGIVNMNEVKAAQSLEEFHDRLTSKITGLPSARAIFQKLSISDNEIQSLKVDTLMMLSKDDPIVSYASMPMKSIESNPNITLHATERGGHLCWFEGLKPKRWYPKPVLQYLRILRQRQGL